MGGDEGCPTTLELDLGWPAYGSEGGERVGAPVVEIRKLTACRLGVGTPPPRSPAPPSR